MFSLLHPTTVTLLIANKFLKALLTWRQSQCLDFHEDKGGLARH